MKKRALITGITGQDGSYLAEFLLAKGYEVHGVIRRSSSFNTSRIEHLYMEDLVRDIHTKKIQLHYGDLGDATGLIRLIGDIQPDEIYNLGAMSHVKVSFDVPEYTADTDGIGTLRLLEAIRILKINGIDFQIIQLRRLITGKRVPSHDAHLVMPLSICGPRFSALS